MMEGKHEIERLPDIEMYGGDTRPWVIIPLREDEKQYLHDTIADCDVALTILPFKASSGMGRYARKMTPTVKIEGTIDEDATIRFSFSPYDTIKLRGMYIYQIEVRHDRDVRCYQGSLRIKQNIHSNYKPHMGMQFDDLPLSEADSMLLSECDDMKFTDIVKGG